MKKSFKTLGPGFTEPSLSIDFAYIYVGAKLYQNYSNKTV